MKTPPQGFTLVELMVVLTILCAFAAITVPAISMTRSSGHRTQCQNNLRQLGVALLQHETTFGHFPCSRTYDPVSGAKTPIHDNPTKSSGFGSWTVAVLPYLEQSKVKSKYNKSQPWHSATNRFVVSLQLPSFYCPASPSNQRVDATFVAGAAAGDYGSINEVKAAFWNYFSAPLGPYPGEGNSATLGVLNKAVAGTVRLGAPRIVDITDGVTQTVMLGECAGRPELYRFGLRADGVQVEEGTGWADPEAGFSLSGRLIDGITKGGPFVINATNDSEAYSFHHGGAQFCYADGHVEFIADIIAPLTYKAKVTRAGKD